MTAPAIRDVTGRPPVELANANADTTTPSGGGGAANTFDLVFEFGDGVTRPSVSAVAGQLAVQWPFTIVKYIIVGDQATGDAVVDIQSSSLGGTWASIAGSSLPTLVAAFVSTNTTLTGWTVNQVTNWGFRAVLNSIASHKKITVTLKCLAT